MSDHLERLAARAQGRADLLQTRTPSLFEPPSATVVAGSLDKGWDSAAVTPPPAAVRAPAVTPSPGAPVEATRPAEATTSSAPGPRRTRIAAPAAAVAPRASRPKPESDVPSAARTMPWATPAVPTDGRTHRVRPPAPGPLRPSEPGDARETAPPRVPAAREQQEPVALLAGAPAPAGTEPAAPPLRHALQHPSQEASPGHPVRRIRPGAGAEDAAVGPPVVKVTIGQVHVRAVVPPPTAPPAERPAPEPALSLDDYLAQDPWGRA